MWRFAGRAVARHRSRRSTGSPRSSGTSPARRSRIGSPAMRASRDEIREAPEATPEPLLPNGSAPADGFLDPVRRYGDLVISAFFAGANDRKRKERLDDIADDAGRAVEALRHRATSPARSRPAIPARRSLDARDSTRPNLTTPSSRSTGRSSSPRSSTARIRGLMRSWETRRSWEEQAHRGIGEGYLDWLKTIHEESHGNADLVAHFFRRRSTCSGSEGAFGLIATNTIGQGDTRSTGLRWICKHGGSDLRGNAGIKWPGQAAVVVSVVHVAKGTLPGLSCSMAATCPSDHRLSVSRGRPRRSRQTACQRRQELSWAAKIYWHGLHVRRHRHQGCRHLSSHAT